MKRALYILLLGLVLAGIVHILVVLLIPSYAAKDAWAQLEKKGNPWEFSIIARPGEQNPQLPSIDPNFWVAACRFDLSEAPLAVEANGDLPFWSVAIFDRQGRNIYSFNDRTSIEKQLFLIVVDAVQIAQLRKNPPADGERAVIVQSESKQGFVLIRALQPDSSWKSSLDAFLKQAKCEQMEILTDNEETSGS